MQTNPLLLVFLFVGIALAVGSNPFITPDGGWDITVGKSYTLNWTNSTDGEISIFLMEYKGGLYPAWSSRISMGCEDLPNNGSATCHISKSVAAPKPYFFSLVDLTKYNENNATAYPSDDALNDSSYFTLHGKSKPTLSSGAIAGIAVGGFFGLALVVFVVYLLMTKQKRKDKNETADLTWFPFPHRDMSEKRSHNTHDVEAPRTPPKTVSSSEATSPTSDLTSSRRVSPRDMTNEKGVTHQAPPPWALGRTIDHEVNHDADH